MAETFGAMATVIVTVEVDLKQCWGNDTIEHITKRTREEAQSYIINLCQTEGKLKLVGIGDCHIKLHSQK